MSDIVTAAVITVCGMVGVSVINALIQFCVTKKVIDSEHQKLVAQIRGEARVRARENRINALHEIVSALVAMIDPDTNMTIDLAKMNSLINRAQLLIDKRIGPEKALNGTINEIGLFIAGYSPDAGVAAWIAPEHRSWSLRMHAALIDAATAVFTGQG